jgi:hypothetical protein
MRFSSARPADEDGVMGTFGERQIGQASVRRFRRNAAISS